MKTPERDVVLADWYATFTQLREQEISLQEWLAYHRNTQGAYK